MLLNPAVPLRQKQRRAAKYLAGNGDDGRSGDSESEAWRSPSRLEHERLGPQPKIRLESGATFNRDSFKTLGLVINRDFATVESWGGAAPATLSNMNDITGTPGLWFEYADDGVALSPGSKKWGIDVAWNGDVPRWFLTFNRRADPIRPGFERGFEKWRRNSISQMSALYHWWARILAGSSKTKARIFVWCPVNPALYDWGAGVGRGLELSGSGAAIDATDRPIKVSNVKMVGFIYGLLCGGGTVTRDLSGQFLCETLARGTNGGYYTHDRAKGFDIGNTADGQNGSGDHIEYYNGAGAVVYPTYLDAELDNCGEDIIQMGVQLGGGLLRLISSYPGATRLTRCKSLENLLDMKAGSGEATWTYFETGPDSAATPLIFQLGTGLFKPVECIVNQPIAASAHQCLRTQEQKPYVESHRTFYYSAGLGVLAHTYSPMRSKYRFDVILNDTTSNSAIVADFEEGQPDMVHCTVAGIGTGQSRALRLNSVNRVADVVSILRVSGPDGNGDYVYALSCTGGQHIIGEPADIVIGNLSGASAALNGTRTIFETVAAPLWQSRFKVPASANPPAIVDKTGVKISSVPKPARLAGNALISPASPLQVDLLASLANLTNEANYLNESKNSSDQPVKTFFPSSSGSFYSTANVVSDTISGSTLKGATGSKMGGSANRVEHSSTGVDRLKYWTITGIVIAGEIATVTCVGHPWVTNDRVMTLKAVPETCNGTHWVTRIDADHFSYQVVRGTADQTATVAAGNASILAWDGTLDPASTAIGTAPVMDLDGETLDGHGKALNGAAPNFGAVQ